MLTSIEAPARPRVSRAAYRPFTVTVARVTRLSANFLRITFTGSDLDEFGAECLDQRIKVVLPLEGHGFTDLLGDDGGADWYTRWRDLPDATRNPLRTYTSRAVRPHLREVDIDFVCHGDTGPASRWARSARVGDPLVLIGPDGLCETSGVGIEWRPSGAESVLLAGDETAAPAICNILESLEPSARGHAFIEVPDVGDILDVRSPDGVAVTWLPRSGAHHGVRLSLAVRHWVDSNEDVAGARVGVARVDDIDLDGEATLWDAPAPRRAASFYAWLAGESETIKGLRRYLVREVGIDRSRVAFMGYWRAGRAEN